MSTVRARRRNPRHAAGRLAVSWVASTLTTLAVATAVLLGGASGIAAGQETSDRRGDVESGERIFQASCAMCHGADASGMMGMHPSLRGATSRLSREGVEVAIRQGRRTEPPMPPFEGRLSDEEINDVIAYIAALPGGPRNFGPGKGGDMMGGNRMMGDGVMGTAAMVVFALLVTGGIVIVVLVVRRSGSSPRRVLDRRYAAGELSREEYLRARQDLNGDDLG